MDRFIGLQACLKPSVQIRKPIGLCCWWPW